MGHPPRLYIDSDPPAFIGLNSNIAPKNSKEREIGMILSRLELAEYNFIIFLKNFLSLAELKAQP